ncbi:MAG: hypothetical protein OXC18_21685 [Desulfurellaceae bacterium]|nr:hypothetical protein [Desulfurellaceae bacterium]
MSQYADNLTVRDGRTQYFRVNKLGDGGYSDRWIRFKVGPLPLFLPNTQARIRAVRFHDIHHVLTEYTTSWTGEAEISAWEISSNCAHHYAAWFLNLQVTAIGLLLNPAAVYRAFVRGRHCTNLYRAELNDALFSTPIGELRQRLGLTTSPPRAEGADRLAFVGWSLCGALMLATPLLIGLVGLSVLI